MPNRMRSWYRSKNRRAVRGCECHVHAALRAAPASSDPEERKVLAEPAHLGHRLHHHPHPQRREGALVERLAHLVVAHVQADVSSLAVMGVIL